VGGMTARGATHDVELRISDQAFQPDVLTIPAGQRVKILVKNEDPSPAEFESNDFNQEKVIPGGTSLPVYVGPLTAGTYKFFNDFHPQSTGKLVVVTPPVPAASGR
jgi:plastocyanin